jgi:hypothetical protein
MIARLPYWQIHFVKTASATVSVTVLFGIDTILACFVKAKIT